MNTSADENMMDDDSFIATQAIRRPEKTQTNSAVDKSLQSTCGKKEMKRETDASVEGDSEDEMFVATQAVTRRSSKDKEIEYGSKHSTAASLPVSGKLWSTSADSARIFPLQVNGDTDDNSYSVESKTSPKSNGSDKCNESGFLATGRTVIKEEVHVFGASSGEGTKGENDNDMFIATQPVVSLGKEKVGVTEQHEEEKVDEMDILTQAVVFPKTSASHKNSVSVTSSSHLKSTSDAAVKLTKQHSSELSLKKLNEKNSNEIDSDRSFSSHNSRIPSADRDEKRNSSRSHSSASHHHRHHRSLENVRDGRAGSKDSKGLGITHRKSAHSDDISARQEKERDYLKRKRPAVDSSNEPSPLRKSSKQEVMDDLFKVPSVPPPHKGKQEERKHSDSTENKDIKRKPASPAKEGRKDLLNSLFGSSSKGSVKTGTNNAQTSSSTPSVPVPESKPKKILSMPETAKQPQHRRPHDVEKRTDSAHESNSGNAINKQQQLEKRKIKVEIVAPPGKSHLVPAKAVHAEIKERQRGKSSGESGKAGAKSGASLNKVQLAAIVVKYLTPFYKEGLFASKDTFKSMARDIAHEADSQKFQCK